MKKIISMFLVTLFLLSATACSTSPAPSINVEQNNYDNNDDKNEFSANNSYNSNSSNVTENSRADSASTLSAEKFATIMNKKGFIIEKNVQATEYGKVISVDADDKNKNLEFEFFVFPTKSAATSAFEDAKNNVKKEVESHYEVQDRSDYYRVFANQNLIVISLIDNTLLCCESEDNTYTEAEKIIKELGYKK